MTRRGGMLINAITIWVLMRTNWVSENIHQQPYLLRVQFEGNSIRFPKNVFEFRKIRRSSTPSLPIRCSLPRGLASPGYQRTSIAQLAH
jgi:hypothetical protein